MMSHDESRPRVFVVEDAASIREMLVAQLEPDYHVLGSCDDGAMAFAHVAALHPDLVIVDLMLPGMSGVDLIRALRQRVPSARIIVFTAFELPDTLALVLTMGVHGLVMKSSAL